MHIKWLAARHIIARVISQIFPQCLYYARSEARDVIISINFSKKKIMYFAQKNQIKLFQFFATKILTLEGKNIRQNDLDLYDSF